MIGEQKSLILLKCILFEIIYFTFDFFKTSKYFKLFIKEISFIDADVKSDILLIFMFFFIFFFPNILNISDK